jgi:hypothetical protein
MLSVIMLSTIMSNVNTLSVITLNYAESYNSESY